MHGAVGATRASTSSIRISSSTSTIISIMNMIIVVTMIVTTITIYYRLYPYIATRLLLPLLYITLLHYVV